MWGYCSPIPSKINRCHDSILGFLKTLIFPITEWVGYKVTDLCSSVFKSRWSTVPDKTIGSIRVEGPLMDCVYHP